MRAVLQEGYGDPGVLRLATVERPTPGPGELLVRVHATTATRGDAMRMRGREYRFTRLFTGVRAPRDGRIGSEFAGVVEGTGDAVTSFAPGDHVFGIAKGANADYVVVAEGGTVAPRPAGISCAEAAALPDGGLLALSMLTPVVTPGARVLVYGAAGSIGSAAVQLLARHYGTHVTAVCDTKDVEAVRALGADVVIDRFAEDFTRRGEQYDLVFDAVGKHSFRRCRRALRDGGTFVTVDLGYLYHVPLAMLVTRVVGRRRARLGVGRYRREDLELLRELVEAGKYRPVIDRMYPLQQVGEAYGYVETGQKHGSVVFQVEEQASADG